MADESKSAGGVAAASAAVPKPKGATFTYGTAGFRGEASGLDSTFLRVGMLAALRGKHQKGQVSGCLCISTALGMAGKVMPV